MASMQRFIAMCLMGTVSSLRPESLSAGDLHTAVSKGQVGAVAVLVADGRDVNGLQDGITPLGIACGKGNQLLVEALLENRADPNMKTGPHQKKELPLGIAAYAQNYDLGVVKALLKAKADAGASDDHKYSALLYARMRGRTAVAE
ncbi:ANKDD1B, partial [Symbiodinium necroappetens]